jgi:hypothetical protein
MTGSRGSSLLTSALPRMYSATQKTRKATKRAGPKAVSPLDPAASKTAPGKRVKTATSRHTAPYRWATMRVISPRVSARRRESRWSGGVPTKLTRRQAVGPLWRSVGSR